MRIAIASGKGGTGKTTVSTNLARVVSRENRTQYLDCDVEEPNGYIFLKPRIEKAIAVTTQVPMIDEEKCDGCGKCRNICNYNAIVLLGKMVLTFSELCHGCGGCALVCPNGAITEIDREIGVIEEGLSDNIEFVHGRLNIGEVLSPLLIKRVQERISSDAIAIIDSPPGTSCPVVQSVKDADYVVLVTEPTPFGLNDLKLAVEMLRVLDLPFGVVVNRADMGDDAVFEYCKESSIEVMMTIPDDRRIAEAYSRGELIVTALPEYREKFEELLINVRKGIERWQ